jgi:two-component system response regulator FixJ
MTPTVFVVDDDADLRDALAQLLETAGLAVESYPDGPSFLRGYEQDRPGCVLLDVAMPGMSGMEVQAALTARGEMLPVVFLTGHGDIPMAVRAVQAGAMDFLEKPVTGADLVERVRRALAHDRELRELRAAIRAVRERCARLTARERDVMVRVIEGASSKEIGRALGLSPRTVEIHRAHIMHKMGADSLADLIRLAAHCKP